MLLHLHPRPHLLLLLLLLLFLLMFLLFSFLLFSPLLNLAYCSSLAMGQRGAMRAGSARGAGLSAARLRVLRKRLTRCARNWRPGHVGPSAQCTRDARHMSTTNSRRQGGHTSRAPTATGHWRHIRAASSAHTDWRRARVVSSACAVSRTPS